MHTTVNAENFLMVIKKCSKFASSMWLAIELGFLFIEKDTVVAFNGHAGIIHNFDLGGIELGQVPAYFVNKLPLFSGSLNISVNSSSIELRSGKFWSKFQRGDLLKKEDFILPQYEKFQCLPAGFFSALKKVYFSISKDETKFSMRGVLFSKNYFYATDNYKVSRFKSNFNLDLEDVVFPDALLSLILSEKAEPVAFAFDSDKLWLVYDEFFVFTTKFIVDFPLSNVFNMDMDLSSKSKIEFDSSFLEVVSRLSSFVENYPYELHLVFTLNKLFLAVLADKCEVVEEVSCKITGYTELVFTVNASFFKELVEKTNQFYVMDEFLYFSKSAEDGILESLLLKVTTNDSESILERVRSSISI